MPPVFQRLVSSVVTTLVAAGLFAAPPSVQEAQTQHWAFQPITDPPLPRTRDPSWSQTSIDRFILNPLEAAGLKPAPRADRRTLIRRATFDLTGLPPTPAEINRFLADPAPDAFARVVDRLLSSRHYGERWGRHWLDVVRYADTAGETADYPVPAAWRYRNYVIDAFNADVPYNEFLRQQIAGDLIGQRGPVGRYSESVVATGYLAISRRFGFDSENYHPLTLQDTIDTVGQSILGLSLGCARCHDHKYDPISTSDYYALYGIFNSTRYAFPGSEQKQKYRALVPLIPPADAQIAWQKFEVQVARLVHRLEVNQQSVPAGILRSLDEIDGDFELQAPAAGGSNGVLVPPWVYSGPVAVTTAAQSPFSNLHPPGKVGVDLIGGTNCYQLGQSVHPRRSVAHCEHLYVNLDFRTDGAEESPGSYRFWLGSQPVVPTLLDIAGMSAGCPEAGRTLPGSASGLPSPALELFLGNRELAIRADDGTKEILTRFSSNQWRNLQLTIDLKARTVSGEIRTQDTLIQIEPHSLLASWTGAIDFIGVNSERSAKLGSTLPGLEMDNLGVSETPMRSLADSPTPIQPSDSEPTLPMLEGEYRRFADSITNIGMEAITGKSAARSSLDSAPVASAEERRKRAGELKEKIAALEKDLKRTREELIEALHRGPFDLAYGVVEGTPANARVQLRGDRDTPGQEVPRGFPKILGGDLLPAECEGSGRLELAGWLTRPENPLTARVIVNRIWQYHFGQGLVKTPNDFGYRGRRPTHPKLLDHLATGFVENGWSIKALHRWVMNSAVYQQASCTSIEPELSGEADTGITPAAVASGLSIDPENELYWRCNRRRLEAEPLRDSVLFVAGELDLTAGEEHPFPAPTTWGYTQHSPFSAIYDHHRRSIYLMTQRLKRHPFLALFDGADPNASTPSRSVSTVPTQALYFLNDPFVHHCAERFADRFGSTPGTDEERIKLAWNLAFGRFPGALERADAIAFLAEYRQALGTTASAPTAVAQSWAALARSLFSSNEFLHID